MMFDDKNAGIFSFLEKPSHYYFSDSVNRQEIQEALERILEVKYFLIQYKEKVEGLLFLYSRAIFILNIYFS